MDKIKKGSIAGLVLYVVGTSIAGIILWPILDFLFDTIFTHSEFVYSVQGHVIEPIIFGCVAGLIFWIFDVIAVKKQGEKSGKGKSGKSRKSK